MKALALALICGGVGSFLVYQLASGKVTGAGIGALAGLNLLLAIFWLAIAIAEVG